MTFTIRPGQPSDRRAVLTMLHEFLGYFAEIDPATSGAFSDRALARTSGLAFERDPFYSLLVAESGGKPVAFLAYHFGVWEIYSALYVAGLFVTKRFRRTGIGRAMMMAVQRLAAERGAERITWTVWRKNKPAIEFYERLGAVQNDEDVAMVWNVRKSRRTKPKAGRRRAATGRKSAARKREP
jgi:GNAT superfamily N-acetyltransferase